MPEFNSARHLLLFTTDPQGSLSVFACLSFSVPVWYILSFSGIRQEYQPWSGARPPKPGHKRPTFLGTGADKPPAETSYQAAFSTDTHRHTDGVQETSTHGLSERAHTHRTEISMKPEVSVRTDQRRRGEKRRSSNLTAADVTETLRPCSSEWEWTAYVI